jgi:hypothetical protein
MNLSRTAAAGLALSLAACSASPPAAIGPAASAKPEPTAPLAPAATAKPAPAPPEDAVPEIPMYPVAEIRSLCSVIEHDGTIELLLCDQLAEPTSGLISKRRYIPILGGLPALDQETAEISFWSATVYGGLDLWGKRPSLMLHTVSGLQDQLTERYQALDEGGVWQTVSLSAPGRGLLIAPWSRDRWLELRLPLPNGKGPKPFALRVLQGEDKQAPSLPAPLAARLEKDGFRLETERVSRAGMVMVLGKLSGGKKLGTLLWTDKLDEPAYFEVDLPKSDEPPDVDVLGGDTPETVRLSLGQGTDARQVWKLEKGTWVVESTYDFDKQPDVWFGAPILRSGFGGALVRSEAGGPWRLVGFGNPNAGSHTWAIDAQGVVWKTEDEVLFSSKKPAGDKIVIDEKALVAARKASILRGGFGDTIEPPSDPSAEPPCSTPYVLLDDFKGDDGGGDYPKIRKALKGHAELSKARFLVTKEKGHVFFGAKVASGAEQRAVLHAVSRAVDKKQVRLLCADPPVAREIKIDLTTGDVVK